MWSAQIVENGQQQYGATSAAAAVSAVAASPAACAEISRAAQFFSHLTAVGARQAHYVP